MPVVLRAGSYRVPAEAFLGPPERAVTTWVGFQSVWSGLPYAAAFPVESCCHRPRSGTAAAPAAASEGGSAAHTAGSIRLSMSPASSCGGGSGSGSGGGSRGGDSRAAAAVDCPVGNTDYAVSTAWAFEAWDGTPVLCALTAMKAPFSLPPAARSPRGGGGGGGGERRPSWHGRFEVRCGSHACSEFAECSPARLARFVTNGVFALPVASPQQQRQQDPFGGAFLPAASPAAAASGGGGGLNGSHPDWFSRTDTVAPTAGSPEQATGGVFATAPGEVKPLVQTLWRDLRVDTMRRAPPTPQGSRGGTVKASA